MPPQLPLKLPRFPTADVDVTAEERRLQLQEWLQRPEVEKALGGVWEVRVESINSSATRRNIQRLRASFRPPGSAPTTQWVHEAGLRAQWALQRNALLAASADTAEEPQDVETPVEKRARIEKTEPRFVSQPVNKAVYALEDILATIRRAGANKEELKAVLEATERCWMAIMEGTPGGAVAFLGNNGVGKTFIINLLLLLTSVDEHQYHDNLAVLSRLKRLKGLEAIKHVMSVLEEEEGIVLPSIENSKTEDEICEMLRSMEVVLETWTGENEDAAVYPSWFNANNEYECTYGSIKRVCHGDSLNSIDATNDTGDDDDNGESTSEGGRHKPFLLPSSNGTSATTAVVVNVQYGTSWHALVEYNDAAWVEQQLQAFRECVKTTLRPALHASVLANKITMPADDQTAKQELHLLQKRYRELVEDEHKSKEVNATLRAEKQKKLGKTFLYAAASADTMLDRCFVRRALQQANCAGNLCRAAIKSITVFAPCRIVKGCRLMDGPGLDDCDPLRLAATQDMLRQATTVVCVTQREAECSREVVQFLQDSRFMRNLCNSPERHHLIWLFNRGKGLPAVGLAHMCRERSHLEAAARTLEEKTSETLERLVSDMLLEQWPQAQEEQDVNNDLMTQVEERMQAVMSSSIRLITSYPLHHAAIILGAEELQGEDADHAREILPLCRGWELLSLIELPSVSAALRLTKDLQNRIHAGVELCKQTSNTLSVEERALRELADSYCKRRRHTQRGRENFRDGCEKEFKPLLNEIRSKVDGCIHTFVDEHVSEAMASALTHAERNWSDEKKISEKLTARNAKDALHPTYCGNRKSFYLFSYLFDHIDVKFQHLIPQLRACINDAASELTKRMATYISSMLSHHTQLRNGETQVRTSVQQYLDTIGKPRLEEELAHFFIAGEGKGTFRTLEPSVLEKHYLIEDEKKVIRRLLESINEYRKTASLSALKQKLRERLEVVYDDLGSTLEQTLLARFNQQVIFIERRLLSGARSRPPALPDIIMAALQHIVSSNEAAFDKRRASMQTSLSMLRICSQHLELACKDLQEPRDAEDRTRSAQANGEALMRERQRAEVSVLGENEHLSSLARQRPTLTPESADDREQDDRPVMIAEQETDAARLTRALRALPPPYTPLRLEDVKADGSCFFHAIARVYFGIQGSDVARQLRSMALDHLWKLQQEDDDYHDSLLQRLNGRTMEDYFQRMAEDTEWADDMVINSLSRALNINLRIWTIDQGQVRSLTITPTAQATGDEYFYNVAHVALLPGGTRTHYMAAVPIEDGEPQEGQPDEAVGEDREEQAAACKHTRAAEANNTASQQTQKAVDSPEQQQQQSQQRRQEQQPFEAPAQDKVQVDAKPEVKSAEQNGSTAAPKQQPPARKRVTFADPPAPKRQRPLHGTGKQLYLVPDVNAALEFGKKNFAIEKELRAPRYADAVLRLPFVVNSEIGNLHYNPTRGAAIADAAGKTWKSLNKLRRARMRFLQDQDRLEDRRVFTGYPHLRSQQLKHNYRIVKCALHKLDKGYRVAVISDCEDLKKMARLYHVPCITLAEFYRRINADEDLVQDGDA
eukprot:jgi/Chlat1/8535/Chrsp82S07939